MVPSRYATVPVEKILTTKKSIIQTIMAVGVRSDQQGRSLRLTSKFCRGTRTTRTTFQGKPIQPSRLILMRNLFSF